MKYFNHILIFTIIMTVCFSFASCKSDDEMTFKRPIIEVPETALKIATYNIKAESASSLTWGKRLDAIGKIFAQYNFDIVGSQEPFLVQIKAILEKIGDEYAYTGTCTTDDGKGLYDPIFYRKDRLQLIKSGVFWLSESPDISAPGFGSSEPRTCCWGKFKDQKTGKEFYCFNTHFEHTSAIGEAAALIVRTKSSELVLKKIKEIANGFPVVLMGDFNCNEDSEPYKMIIDNTILKDALRTVEVPINSLYPSLNSYNPVSQLETNGLHIDHLFFTYENSKAYTWKLLTDSYEGQYGSDHFPLLMEWNIE